GWARMARWRVSLAGLSVVWVTGFPLLSNSWEPILISSSVLGMPASFLSEDLDCHLLRAQALLHRQLPCCVGHQLHAGTVSTGELHTGVGHRLVGGAVANDVALVELRLRPMVHFPAQLRGPGE